MPKKPLYPMPDEVEIPEVEAKKTHRRCTACGKLKPLTVEFWNRDDTKSEGFREMCKVCRAKRRRDSQSKQALTEGEQALSVVDRDAAILLNTIIESKQGLPTSTLPHIATMFEKLMEVFGGAEGFAQHFMHNFLMAAPGSQQRQRMMDSMMRLGIKTTEAGSAKIPLELLSEDDLEREIAKRMESRKQLIDGRVTKGQTAEPAGDEGVSGPEPDPSDS